MPTLVRRVQAFPGNTDAYFEKYTRGPVDFLKVAEDLRTHIQSFAKFTSTSTDYHHLVVGMFENTQPLASQAAHQPTSLAEAIRALNLPIITTNYDVVLDRVLDRLPINVLGELLRAYQSDTDGKAMKKFLSLGLNHGSKFVYHVHGVYSEREGFTLSQSEYDEQADAFRDVMKKLLGFDVDGFGGQYSMLFIGVGAGMFDSHMLLLLRELQRESPTTRHFWLVQEQQVEGSTKRLKKEGVTTVDVLSFGAKREDLTPFLWRLARDAANFHSTVIKVTTRTEKVCTKTKQTITVPAGAETATTETVMSATSPDPPAADEQSITTRVTTYHGDQDQLRVTTIRHVVSEPDDEQPLPPAASVAPPSLAPSGTSCRVMVAHSS